MAILATGLVLIVALIHVYIVILEMFLWRKERGRRAFGTDQEFADRSATLAANQGLYNGFLVAGLVWGVGALTVNRRILFVQALPAFVALAVVLLAR
jgi:putative membrane protein